MSDSSGVKTKIQPLKPIRRGRVIDDFDVDIGNLCILDAALNWTAAFATARNSSFATNETSDIMTHEDADFNRGDGEGGEDSEGDTPRAAAVRTAAVGAAAQRAAELLFSRLAALPAAEDTLASAELRVSLPPGRELLPAVSKRKPTKPSKSAPPAPASAEEGPNRVRAC